MAKYIFRAGKLTVCVLLPLFIVILITWGLYHKSYAQIDSELSQVTELSTLAEAYAASDRYAEAEAIWLSLIQQQPETEVSKAATENLTLLYARTGNDPNAFSLLTDYITKYPSDYSTAVVVGQVANVYQGRGRYDLADTLHGSAVENWPGTDQAMASRAGMILAEVCLGQDPNVPEMTDNLIFDFSDNPNITRTLCELFGRYCEYGHYEEAFDLFQKIEQGRADDRQVIAAAAIKALSDVGYGVDPNAVSSLSELAKTNAQATTLAPALMQASSIYFAEAIKSNSRKDKKTQSLYNAIEALGYAMESPSVTPEESAEACYQIAECYRILGQEDNALSYYELVVENWPVFEYVWNAHYMIGHCSEKLSRKGLMDSNTAESNCVRAYTQVSENFPTCPAAKAAFGWLKTHGIAN